MVSPEFKRAAEAVGQVGWAHRKIKDFANARPLHQHVVEHWPDNERAIYSQRAIIFCDLALRDWAHADVSIDKLLGDYSPHKDAPQVVHDLDYDCRQRLWQLAARVGGAANSAQEEELTFYDEIVCRISEHILEQWPKTRYAMWAQRSIAFAHIHAGRYDEAAVAVERLKTDYPSHEGLPQAFIWLGNDYMRMQQFESAYDCYQYVVERWPESELVVEAKVNLGGVRIRQGEEQGARAAFDEVITEYQDGPEFAQVMRLTATVYWEAALADRRDGLDEQSRMHFEQALFESQGILDLQDSPDYTPWAHYLAGMCYRLLGEDDQVVACYEKLIEDWPDFERAWDAQYQIGRIYADLGKEGKIPRDTGEAKAKAAFEAVVRDYPDCISAKAAQAWVEHYDRKAEQKDERRAMWEHMIAVCPDTELAERGRQWLKENGFLNEGEER